MLTVITPATSTALASLERAATDLGVTAGSKRDRQIVRYIEQASRVIVDHCRRPFGLETVRETFIVNEIRGDGPLFGRGPVVEILAVRDGSGTLIAPSGYVVDHSTGRLRCLDANGFPQPWGWDWGSGLSVEYRAGYVLPTDDEDGNLPEPIERACVLLVATYLAAQGRDPTVKVDTVEGLGSRSFYVAGADDKLVTPEAQQLLAPFVRFYP
ncbi:hypothetical protein [Methylobacterium brachiatum]|uniref:hypothetical protein n=1 Tax=Methylobacterium brachiatum TaxID=269660 RepID=UPI0024479A2A|nr:hypothetical protein [Methylobacterium brachiatum]MDH2313997.1 hypothetical protein [Methylobacterium brachiatum]